MDPKAQPTPTVHGHQTVPRSIQTAAGCAPQNQPQVDPQSTQDPPQIRPSSTFRRVFADLSQIDPGSTPDRHQTAGGSAPLGLGRGFEEVISRNLAGTGFLRGTHGDAWAAPGRRASGPGLEPCALQPERLQSAHLPLPDRTCPKGAREIARRRLENCPRRPRQMRGVWPETYSASGLPEQCSTRGAEMRANNRPANARAMSATCCWHCLGQLFWDPWEDGAERRACKKRQSWTEFASTAPAFVQNRAWRAYFGRDPERSSRRSSGRFSATFPA